MFEPDDGAFGFSMEVLRDRAAALPGVERAALAAGTPFGNLMNSILVLPGGEGPDVGTVESNLVDPDYFAALGTRILEGRGFGNMDVTGAPPVMIVSQTLARKLWPGESALGKCAHPGEPSSPCLEVVGVAQDVRGRDMAEEQLLQYYRPRSQEDRKIRETLVLRVALPPDRILPSLRRELQAMLPASVFLEIQPLHAGLQGQTRNWRVGARVFGAFGGMALAMAAIGLFSVVAYDVRQRRGEFGVRMAFGARPVDLIRLVVAGGLRLAGVGVIAGLLVAAALVGRLGELLFRVEPLDPLTFLGVGAILLASAVVASWVATSGACRTEVTAVLRSE